ncbi:MAG: T9SS type A sorting domain-containing protein [Ignavibacteria bacterium]|nr:T9SS type A sorting domain-containing protein [Ignavibacteria bacterium]
MKKLSNTFLLLLLLGYSAAAVAGQYPGGDEKQKGMAKTTANDKYDFIGINNILMWIGNNGSTAHNPSTDASGLEWPRGSAKYAIFTDGLIWGGTVQGEVRVGGATYRYGLQAGPIKADGQAADAADPRYKIYKVRKASPETYARLTPDEQARLKADFNNWPVGDGAPWTDKNANGIYEPNFDDWLADNEKSGSDTPFFVGDEVLWFISNDLDPGKTSNLYGTSPIGLEVQTLVWGYDQNGPLGNMIFTKYTVKNKGTNSYDNAYLAKWSDPDLGDANDDLCGIDTSLVLGYIYNGFAKDGIYGVPPAAGYDFFQGPIVPGDPGDVARYNFGTRPGYKNLGVSSFAYYINGDGVYVDPDLGVPKGSTQMYNYMRSLLYSGAPFVDPTTQLQAKVCLAGDPITKTGWVDGILQSPGDRRFLMTAGPFTLAQGDEQEIVVATIVGRGSDRLSSLQVLKYYDRFAQLAFDNNFDLPKAPPTPNLKISQQPGTIVLNWGDPKSALATEKFSDRGYTFQGYNVYQFPSKSSTISEAKRIATFDLVDNIATIFDEVIDDRSGAVVTLPVQFGTDAGIERRIELTRDLIIDRPLVNNQPYYYAVTAYSYNPDPDAPPPHQLESTPRILEARPMGPKVGVRYGQLFNEKFTAKHDAGSAVGSIDVQVIDPSLLTGNTYEVTFESAGMVKVFVDPDSVDFPNFGWNLTNVNTGTKLVDKATKYNGLTSDYFVVDGFMIGASGAGYPNPDKQILSADWIGGPAVYSYNTEWEMGELFFGSTLTWLDVKKTIEVRFSKDPAKHSKGYAYQRGATPNYAFQGYFDCPFTVWDVTNPAAETQLSFAFVEQKGVAAQNNTWDPIAATDREYLFILDLPYTVDPRPEYTAYKINADAVNMPVLFAVWPFLNQTYPTSTPWREGDKWKVVPNVPFSSDDKYSFTTIPQSYKDAVAAQDISQITVFPNPYYGANAQELNKYQRFVTFNHLPQHAKFRIFTVSGTLVRSFEKNDASQLVNWDLLNENNLPVGSGMYIIHIDMPELGVEKILKLGVVSETQYLDRI